MKKLFILLSILILLVISLSGCSSSAISNQQLKEDILTIQKLALISNVKDLTIIEKSETSTFLKYKLNTILESSGFSATADIALEYIKKDSKWVLNNSSVNVININAKYEPAFTSVVKGGVEKVSDILIDHPGLIGLAQTYNLVSQSGSKESGFISMVISEAYRDDVLAIEIEYWVDATFDIQSGWNFSLKDWVKTETMSWEGTYDLNWIEATPGYPSGELSKYYVVGEMINDIVITGDAVFITQMDKTEKIQNSLRIKYQYKGKEVDVQPIFDDLATVIHFTVNPDDINNSTLYFQYNVPRKDYVDPNYQAYDVYEPFIYGRLVKQP